MEEFNAIGNVKIDEKGFAIFNVNPKIFGLDIIYSAAYILMDQAYIFLDGHPEEEIIVEIRAKEGYNLKDIIYNFNNELLNYAVYKEQQEKNKEIRETLLQRVLLTNDPEYLKILKEKPEKEKKNFRWY